MTGRAAGSESRSNRNLNRAASGRPGPGRAAAVTGRAAAAGAPAAARHRHAKMLPGRSPSEPETRMPVTRTVTVISKLGGYYVRSKHLRLLYILCRYYVILCHYYVN